MNSIEFLRKWKQGGPWVLTSIQTDRKGIHTQTFYEKDAEALENWLNQYNGKRNIYFHVNPPTHDLKKKAEREDIKELSWLHVDIDPRAGEDIEDERERALNLLTERLPKGVPAPTVIVFSGGGFQGFWRLENPIIINGDLAKAEDAKRYNQQLEILFGADNCHNIDRIMRLPGTMNIPDARKQKKGRKPELAKVVEFNENIYALKNFTPAAAVQMADDSGFSGSRETVKISGNIERIQDVSELDEWSVPDRIKIIIVQGSHPDEVKQGDNSRSAWVFDAICNMVRRDVPDDIIFSILTDPDYDISESILEKGSNAEKYAIRQIERAKEEVIDPWLRKLNEKFAVIGNMGGKCRIVEEVHDPALNRSRLTKQSFDDFCNRYANIDIEIGISKTGVPQTQKLGRWWKEHPKRRQYDSLIFAPGKEVSNAYNLWKGFSCESLPGDCSLFLKHIEENICQGNQVFYEYLISWLARAIQQPDSPGEVAVVLRGGRGVGKSLFAKEFGKLFGRHFLQVSNAGHLVGNFNSHLRDTIVLFADEAFFAGDKKHSSVLKTLITEETITIEAKGVDVEAAPNYVHLIMASNDMHVIPAGGDERRFFVLDVGKQHQQDASYFGLLMKQMENGGREALLHYLMTYDISDYQVRNVPQTDALKEQKMLSLSPEEDWWYQKLLDGRLLEKHEAWVSEVMKREIIDDFIDNHRRFNVTRRGTATQLGRFLNRVCPTLTGVQKMAEIEVNHPDGWSSTKKERTYFWKFPSLTECRARWDEFYGGEKWSEEPQQFELNSKKDPF